MAEERFIFNTEGHCAFMDENNQLTSPWYDQRLYVLFNGKGLTVEQFRAKYTDLTKYIINTNQDEENCES